VPGHVGEIFAVISYVVIFTLLFSLLESLTVLPVHITHDRLDGIFKIFSKPFSFWPRFQKNFSDKFDRVVSEAYQPLLRFATRYRYLTLVASLSMLVLAVGLVGGGWIRFTFFPEVEADFISAGVTMPEGTSAELTARALAQLEESAFKVKEELENEEGPVFKHMLTTLGGQPLRAQQGGRMGGGAGSIVQAHLGELTIELVSSEERKANVKDIERRWRESTGDIPGALELSFSSAIFSAGDAINIRIAGADFEEMSVVAEELKAKLATYAGVYSITDTYRTGKKEYRIKLSREGEMAGLSLAELGRQVRQAFYGEEAQRILRGRDEIKVMVRYTEEERSLESTLERMRVRLKDGTEVPFLTVGRLVEGEGFAAITRVSRMRTVSVTADVDESMANAQEIRKQIAEKIFPGIRAIHPDLKFTFEGAQREQRDTIAGLIRGFAVALLIIYALMAIPFASYIQPLIIMMAIPFGFIGAIMGHLLLGLNITILSMFGLVALTGVVINDGLLLVNFINEARKEGLELFDAIMRAGRERFRPVLLTSFTTFAGLLPMIFETSTQAQFLIPIAVSLAFGVLFATFITLVLVPAEYVIIEDIKRGAGQILQRISRKLQ